MDILIQKEKDSKYDYEVLFDRKYVGEASGNWSHNKEFHIRFILDILKLSNHFTIEDFFEENIYSFSLPVDLTEFKYLDWIEINRSSIYFESEHDSCVCVYPNLLEWNKSINLLGILHGLDKRLSQHNLKIDFDTNILEEGFFITFKPEMNKSISSEYRRILSTINNATNSIIEENEINKSENQLLSIFSFSPEVRQACEQYLIYFSRFLADLGIEVTSKLDCQAKTTFFTIIPKDSDEALKNIKELLDIYLSLPETDDTELQSSGNIDVSVQHLLSNVYHLKSQLILANSIIQTKDATIESLKFINQQQSHLIDSKVNKNQEKTLDGLLTINEYEAKGFNINLPEIFRRLKRVLKK